MLQGWAFCFVFETIYSLWEWLLTIRNFANVSLLLWQPHATDHSSLLIVPYVFLLYEILICMYFLSCNLPYIGISYMNAYSHLPHFVMCSQLPYIVMYEFCHLPLFMCCHIPYMCMYTSLYLSYIVMSCDIHIALPLSELAVLRAD